MKILCGVVNNSYNKIKYIILLSKNLKLYLYNNAYMHIVCAIILAGVPYDGEPEIEVLTVHPGLTALVLTLTAAGATFATACIIFNFVYRNRRSVDSSS